MKRFLLFPFNIFFLILIMLSAAFLKIGPSDGKVLEYLRQPGYTESSQFETLSGNMVADVFNYISYTDLFETDGNLNLRLLMATAETDTGTVSYSLDYLIQYARQLGYYFNDRNELVTGNSSSSISDRLNNRVRVISKTYNPEFSPNSPSDGLMSLGDLSVEALGYLSEYYKLKQEFPVSQGNFYFNVTYLKDGEERVFTNFPSKTEDDIRNLQKHLYSDSSSMGIISSFNHYPQELSALISDRDPFQGGSEYRMSIGIDTEFKEEDVFLTSFLDYTRRRSSGITGLIFLSVSIVCFLLSLIFLIIFSCSQSDSQRISFHTDDLPPEFLIIIFLIFIPLSSIVSKNLIISLSNILGDLSSVSGLLEMFTGFFIRYIVFLPIMLSLIRNYTSGRLLKRSLLGRLSSFIMHYINAGRLSGSMYFTYFLFILPNILGFVLTISLYVRFFRRHSLYSFISATFILFIIMALDFYSWHISDGLKKAVDDQVRAERMKTDLITNVSHDLKTPLTSIISYIELMKREDIESPRVREYLSVLDQKSNRLKTLTEDLVEASRASSGNVKIELCSLDLVELTEQAFGELKDKLDRINLDIVYNFPASPVMVSADGRHLWRILENLINNCAKYALPGSRVYVSIEDNKTEACFTMKNISARPLNISPEELTERFVRGDESRSTEGSGLGLSISKSLASLLGGRLVIAIDGDLYKASVVLKKSETDS